MGVQFGPYATDQGTPDANFGAAVDGNYGFGDGCFNGTLDATDPTNPVCVGGTFDPLPGGRDYLVEVEVPERRPGPPTYQVTREEDINIANGDQFVPQVPPPACAGPLHTVDVAGLRHGRLRPAGRRREYGAPRRDRAGLDARGQPDVRSTSARRPYEGQARPLLRREAGAAQQRQVDRPDLQRLHRRPAARHASGASSSTTSTSPAIPARCSTARRRACRSRRWASTTAPTGWSHRRIRLQRPVRRAAAVDATASAARRPRASAPTCTASSATTRARRARST